MSDPLNTVDAHRLVAKVLEAIPDLEMRHDVHPELAVRARLSVGQGRQGDGQAKTDTDPA